MVKKSNIHKIKKILLWTLFWLGLFIILLFFIIPYFTMLMGSFKPVEEFMFATFGSKESPPSFLPHRFTFQNYAIVLFFSGAAIKCFVNSLKVSIGTTILTLSFGILAAYGLSRFYFKFKSTYKIALFFTQMVPSVSFLLPFYIIYYVANKHLHIPLKETHIGLILTYTSFSLPFAVLMLTKFFNSIPRDYDDQALIDGCSRFTALFKIIVPVSMPAIYTIGIYSFLISWNEILFASVLTSRNTRTVSVGLLELQNPAYIMAGCVLSAIPILIIFSYYRKYCISGMTGSGLK